MADTPRVAAPLQHGRMDTLTGATDSLGILVTPTSSAGETIHKNTSGSTQLIYLFATNNHGSAVVTTFEWGGTGAGNLAEFTLADAVTTEIVSGIPLAPGKTVAAYAAQADKVTIWGYAVTIG